jgi:hypothetical protein
MPDAATDHPEAKTGLSVEPIPLPTSSPAVQALPEAPVSLNAYITIEGHQVQATLRGTDAAEVLTRMHALLQRYPVPQAAPAQGAAHQLSPQQHNATAMGKKAPGVCPVHNVMMQENTKDGRSWYSHRHEGRWCKGR